MDQEAKIRKRLHGLLFVPPGEVDDTRFEMFYSLLCPCIESGPEMLKAFIELGALEVFEV